jgi:hypothetical protein
MWLVREKPDYQIIKRFVSKPYMEIIVGVFPKAVLLFHESGLLDIKAGIKMEGFFASIPRKIHRTHQPKKQRKNTPV